MIAVTVDRYQTVDKFWAIADKFHATLVAYDVGRGVSGLRGGDTFAKKEELKAMGFRFDGGSKTWYAADDKFLSA